jgi:hypothetical protein
MTYKRTTAESIRKAVYTTICKRNTEYIALNNTFPIPNALFLSDLPPSGYPADFGVAKCGM